MPPGFKLPEVEENAESWGPVSVPEQFRDVPFMPYSKGDRLGRIADFGQMAQQRQFQGRYRDQMSGPAVFNFEKAEEEETFQLIDNKPVKKPAGQQQRRGQGGRGWGQQGGRGWGQQDQRGAQQDQRGGPAQRGRGGGQQQQRRQQQWGGYRPWDQPRTQYTSSVDIRPEWHVVGDQINFSALQKLTTQVAEPTDLVSCGDLAFYDKAADRVTPKIPAKLRRTAARTRSTSTSEDPVIRRLAAEGAGQVFMTDALLTTLMCAPRSVYPWDIVITRKGDKLFLDKRANSSLDFLTNGETAPDPLPEEKDNVNGVQALGVEATAVNQAFREQVLSGGERHSLGQAPEMGGHTHAGYKYRKWSLGGTDLVVRCEVDGAIKLGEGVQLLAVHALNEFDPKWSGVDWRQKLENQRGAVLATELKNNANKMAKWTAAALLSGVDLIKLGYLTRAGPKDNRNHLLLGTQAVKPKDFAAQMNLNMDNCWGIVRALIDLCMEKLDTDGKYLMVKDPNKPQLRIYAVPANEAIDTQYTEAVEGEGEEEGAAAKDEE